MITGHVSLSFLDLAEQVLAKAVKPLTINEIWSGAEGAGLLPLLKTEGKTPVATLGARLYMAAKSLDSKFAKIGARPARFMLKSSPLVGISPEDLEKSLPETALTTASIGQYHERRLHPLLVWFARTRFDVESKTILHEKSVKKGPKHNQWLHPDIAGFVLNSKDWNGEVVGLAKRNGCKNARLFSFELKVSIDFSTLREYFFQAVSNSSWANQAYLAVAEIDEDPDFREELTRLSESFGIGVIRLNVGQPLDSEVLLPARETPEVDWETVSRIAEDNSDFRDYVSAVAKSLEINAGFTKGFDHVFTDEQMFEYATKELTASPKPHLSPAA